VRSVLEDRGTIFTYEPGSWGPAESSKVLVAGDRWHAPRRVVDADAGAATETTSAKANQ
jgi:hypothetical protein